MPQIRIGTSGWNYRHWRGRFYPEGLPQRRELEYASQRFNSIEINGSFYSLKRPAHYQAWYEGTPHGFLFAVKGSRFITQQEARGRGDPARELLRLGRSPAAGEARPVRLAAST